MKKLKLSVKDRLDIPHILPKKGGMIQQEVVRSVIEKIRFTPEEVAELDLKDMQNGAIAWKREKDTGVEFSFQQPQVDVMIEGVDALDKAGEVSQELLDLCLTIKNLTKAAPKKAKGNG